MANIPGLETWNVLLQLQTTQLHIYTLPQQSAPVATGGFGGLSPPNKAPSPFRLKHNISVEFWSIFRMSSPTAQTQSSLLKTF